MALGLLADHELATSTVAVRVAASTRADLYDATLAGLGTLAGPLHGGASPLAYALIVDAERHGVERALNECLRWQRVLPGFGHSVYKHGDPRVHPASRVLRTTRSTRSTPTGGRVDRAGAGP